MQRGSERVRTLLIGSVLVSTVLAFSFAGISGAASESNATITDATVEQSTHLRVTDRSSTDIPEKFERNTDSPLVEFWTASQNPDAALTVLATDTTVDRGGANLLVFDSKAGTLESYPIGGFPAYSRTTVADGLVVWPGLVPRAFDIESDTQLEYEGNPSEPPILGYPRGPAVTDEYYVQTSGGALKISVRHDQYDPDTVSDRPVRSIEGGMTARNAPWVFFNEQIIGQKIDYEWGSVKIAASGDTLYYIHDSGYQGYSRYLVSVNLTTGEASWSNAPRDVDDMAVHDGTLYVLDGNGGYFQTVDRRGTPGRRTDILGGGFWDAGPENRPERGELEHVGDRFVVSKTFADFDGTYTDYTHASTGVTVYDRKTGEITVGDQVSLGSGRDPPADPVAVADGRVYFAVDGELQAYNMTTGEAVLVDSDTSFSGSVGAVAATNESVSIATINSIYRYQIAEYTLNASPTADGNGLTITVSEDDNPVQNGTIELGGTTHEITNGTVTVDAAELETGATNSNQIHTSVTVTTGSTTLETDLRVSLSRETTATSTSASDSSNDGSSGGATSTDAPFIPAFGGVAGTLLVLLAVSWWRS